MCVEKNGKNIAAFTNQAMHYLISHHWPGNARELMNTIEWGVVSCRESSPDQADFSSPHNTTKADLSTFKPENQIEMIAPLEEV